MEAHWKKRAVWFDRAQRLPGFITPLEYSLLKGVLVTICVACLFIYLPVLPLDEAGCATLFCRGMLTIWCLRGKLPPFSHCEIKMVRRTRSLFNPENEHQ